MSKPYVYLDRYKRDGFVPAIKRQIPTSEGSHVRVAFHGVGDGARSLEVYVQPNGYWSVDTGPGPAHGGERRPIVRGRLPIDGHPESVSYVYGGGADGHLLTQLRRVREAGPAPDEDFHRLKVTGTTDDPHGGSVWLNISPAQLDRIIAALSEA